MKYLSKQFLSLTILTALILSGFSSSAQEKMSRQDYIDTYSVWAVQSMESYGIPASITLAQGILESASGNSALAKNARNHFGIKCHKGWQGKGYYMDDDTKDECFRVYESAQESFRDHSEFLTTRSRYADLFKLEPDDYTGWAKGLKKAGYATNPKYAHLLIKIIEDMNLSYYDEISSERLIALQSATQDESIASNIENHATATDFLPKPGKPGELVEINGIPAVFAGSGQSLLAIAVKYDEDRRLLARFNEIDGNKVLEEGTIIFLKPKKRKGDIDMHIVKPGESTYDIAQMHGIKLKHLYKKNLMEPNMQVVPGELVYLRNKRETPPKQRSYRKYLQEVEDMRLAEQRLAAEKLKKAAEEKKAKEAAIEKTDLQNETASQQVNATVEEQAKDRVGSTKTESKKQAKEVDTAAAPEEVKDEEKTLAEANIAAEAKAAEQVKVKYHTVASGETLYALKRRYGVEVSDLLHWNNLSSPNIKIGQQLIVGK